MRSFYFLTVFDADLESRKRSEVVRSGAKPSVSISTLMATAMVPMSRTLTESSFTRILIITFRGTAAGLQYGVAQKANIIAVKVMSDLG